MGNGIPDAITSAAKTLYNSDSRLVLNKNGGVTIGGQFNGRAARWLHGTAGSNKKIWAAFEKEIKQAHGLSISEAMGPGYKYDTKKPLTARTVVEINESAESASSRKEAKAAYEQMDTSRQKIIDRFKQLGVTIQNKPKFSEFEKQVYEQWNALVESKPVEIADLELIATELKAIRAGLEKLHSPAGPPMADLRILGKYEGHVERIDKRPPPDVALKKAGSHTREDPAVIKRRIIDLFAKNGISIQDKEDIVDFKVHFTNRKLMAQLNVKSKEDFRQVMALKERLHPVTADHFKQIRENRPEPFPKTV